MTTFAKANELFKEKSASKTQTGQSLEDFAEQYAQGGQPSDKPTPVVDSTTAAGPGQELFVNTTATSADPLGTVLGSNWVMSGGTISTANSNQESPPAAHITSHSISGQIQNSSTPGSYQFGGTTENITISNISDSPIGDVSIGGTIPYRVFDLPLASSAPAKTTYNFYIQDYERFLDTLEENETSLLDIYGTVLSLTTAGAMPSLNKMAQRRAQGTSLTRGLQAPRRQGEPGVPDENIKTFFRRYATEDIFQNDRYKNVFFPAEKLSEANSVISNSRRMFPFYAGFDINMAESGEVSDNLRRSNFANTMMKNVAATLDNGDVYQRESFVRNSSQGNFNATVKTWNLMDLLDYSDPGFINRSAVLGDEEDLVETFPEAFYQFASVIDKIAFLSNLQETIQNNSLNFVDIVNGKNCYTEVLLYRVAKYRSDDLNKPFQNFYFFNSSEVDKFKFLDSQVKPGMEYFYKVFTYSIVIGAEYTYNQVINERQMQRGQTAPENFTAISLVNNVSLRIVENLIQTTRTFVASRPPICPEISFRSFIGESKKIQLLFQDRVDLVEEHPISFSAEETERMIRIRTAQGIGMEQPVKFQNDDGIKVYEIYRTTTPPETIRDFSDKLWRRVTEKENLDKVTPDTTYYYMFRSVDNHGNVSNPSAAFEVTLIGGVSPYLIVNNYEFPIKEDDLLRPDKKFKRFLRIRPALQQLLLNRTSELTSKQSSADVFSTQLGTAPEGTVWGKKYKIRIKSIETGKKMDFNIDYTYKFEHRDE